MNPPMPPCQVCGGSSVIQYLDLATGFSISRCAEHNEYMTKRPQLFRAEANQEVKNAGNYLEMSRVLPCGCSIKFRSMSEERRVETDEFFAKSLSAMNYWFEDRASRHKCELVSDENPCGIEPKKKCL